MCPFGLQAHTALRATGTGGQGAAAGAGASAPRVANAKRAPGRTTPRRSCCGRPSSTSSSARIAFPSASAACRRRSPIAPRWQPSSRHAGGRREIARRRHMPCSRAVQGRVRDRLGPSPPLTRHRLRASLRDHGPRSARRAGPMRWTGPTPPRRCRPCPRRR